MEGRNNNNAKRTISGEILTAKDVTAYNDFSNGNRVKPEAFNEAKFNNGNVTLTIPPKSIIVLQIK